MVGGPVFIAPPHVTCRPIIKLTWILGYEDIKGISKSGIFPTEILFCL